MVSTNKRKYSETFIHTLVSMLPFDVHYLHSGYLPTRYGESDTPFVDDSSDEASLKNAIKSYLTENRIKLVLAEYGPSGVKVMNICAELTIPLIVYFHGYDAFRKDILESYGHDYPQLFQIAKKIFVVSIGMKKQLITLGASAEKIILNPCGADTSMFQYHDAGKNPPIFLFVGRFEASKSPHLAILAFARAYEKIRESKLIMVGDGHLQEACRIMTKALKLEHAIEFKGVLPHSEIAQLMSHSRALLQHSVTTPSNDSEGTPVSVMEASASGLPVIATYHAGIPDVVEHGKTGSLVEEGNIEGMAEFIIQIANDPVLSSRLGKAGSEKIHSQFTANRYIEIVTQEINKLL